MADPRPPHTDRAEPQDPSGRAAGDVDGADVTWDPDAGAGYARTGSPAAVPLSTVEVSPGVLVDVDASGSVHGVETIGHVVGVADLLAVLACCRLEGPASGQ